MKRKCLAVLLVAVMAAGLLPGTAWAYVIPGSPAAGRLPGTGGSASPKITLSEQYLYAGACEDWYTEEAYRASPVVIDLDGDGKLEVLNAAWSLSVMDAATGAVKWRVNAGRDRSTAYNPDPNSGANVKNGQVFTDFEVLDIDGDGKYEIVIAYGDGTVSVLNDQGYFEDGWPQKPISSSVRSLAVGDLNGDGKMEIVVGMGIDDSVSVWVYDCHGNVVKGWPQLDPTQDGSNYGLTDREHLSKTAYSYGVFGDGIALGDVDGDGLPEVIVPTDNAYINVYNYDGSLVMASDIYADEYGPRAWGKIALYESYEQELSNINEGWGWPITGNESRAELYRAELGHSKAILTDVDGDGVSEVVVTALMTDRTTQTKGGVPHVPDTKYMTVYILNQDRSRYVNGDFDWSAPPVDLGVSRKSNDPESMAANVFSEPVAADLDGDGYQEILFNSYNGKLHCFSLDGTEHGSWPFTLPKNTDSIYEYATPPVCVDLDGDGTMEVVFASWTDCELENRTGTAINGGGTGVNGALYVLSCDGEILASIDLHNGYCKYEERFDLAAGFSNGVMGSPTVEDIDGDGKYEVLLNTTFYALCAYEITVGGDGAAATPDIDFIDVGDSDWFADPVYWAVENSLAAGTGEGKFSPYDTCTHVQIITFLWRAAGKRAPSAARVPVPIDENQWYTVPLYWAAGKGMLDEGFDPNAPCTRAEAAVYIWKAFGRIGANPCGFSDANPDVFGWGTDKLLAVSWAAANGITAGYEDGTFRPNDLCSRGHIITFLYRAYVKPYTG